MAELLTQESTLSQIVAWVKGLFAKKTDVKIYVGTCSTAAATNPKVCTVEDFPTVTNDGVTTPVVGTVIGVKFSATNTSTSTTPQLNVNGTGAYRIWYNNAALATAKSPFAGYANRYIYYVWDGERWVFLSHSVDNNTTYSNYSFGNGLAVQNNTAEATAITATYANYALSAHGRVSVVFTHDVLANSTLNINSKGAKSIYYYKEGVLSLIEAGMIKAHDVATFVYNGTHYVYVSKWFSGSYNDLKDKPTKVSEFTNDSGYLTGETDPTVPSWAKQPTKPSYASNEITDSNVGGTIDQTMSSMQTNINNKVDKETGKGLSTNDYTTTEKTKLAGIEAGAEKNVQGDWAQNDTTADDYIKNRTHYVENVANDVWYQTGCNVGSGTTSPGGYPATFNITTGDKYNVTISQGSTSKTYEGLTAEYDSVFNGLALRKNWSNSMGVSDTSTDALLLVVQPSNVVLRSADIYGENCTVQVSEVTETIHKLDPKYLPDNVNQIEDITTSKSGKVTTVTFEQTNGTQTQFQVTDGNDGTNGKSAYQVAVDNGYSGTEAQWLASLKGADGVSLGEVELTQEVTTATDSVPANKAVYNKVQRVDVEKANKSNYDDSQWLQDQGWKLNYRLFIDNEIADSNYCISPMFPFVYGHTYTLSYQFNANNNSSFTFYTDEGIRKDYYRCNVKNVRTVTPEGATSSCTQMRGTFSLSNIRQCYIHDDTANEYIFKGDEYLDSLIAESNKEFDNLIDYKTYKDELLVQELNQSATQVPSAKAVQDGIEVYFERQLHTIQIQEGLISPSNACLELTDDQIECLNESEEMTIICVARSFDSSTPNYGYYGGQSNGSVRIVLWHNSILSVSRSNTTNINNIGSNTYLKDMNMVTINRTTGLCKHYRGTTLVAEKVLTSAVGDNFFVDNKFYFYSGSSNIVYYDFHLYNADITKLIGTLSAYNIVSGVLGVNSIYKGFPTRWDAKTIETRPSCYNYNSSKVTQSLGNDNKYHYTANTADYVFFCFMYGAGNKQAVRKIWEIEIVSGMMQIAQNKSGLANWTATGLNWWDIYDENGVKQEADADGLIEIGVGNWTLVEYNPKTTAQNTSTVKLKGEPFEMIVKQCTTTNIVCVAHIPCNILYDGQLYDDQAEVMYSLYNTNFTEPYSPARSMNKLQVPTTASLPHYPGEIRIADGKVYASTDWNTWKQISN